jgi:hypothetical protein
MIQADRTSGFTLPFMLGTILGVLGGTLVGVLISRQIIGLMQRIAERATGSEKGDGPRLDLLLQ